MEHQIARYTLSGVRDAEVSTHPFATEDELGLTLTRFHRAGSAHPDDVVLLVHGLTSASDIFIVPETRNMVSHLLDSGFGDVWALDFRMSSRFPYNMETRKHTLDAIARYDYPAALTELRRHVGARRIHVIAHCLGSVSFCMSLFGGAIDGITSVVANSVALTPRVPSWSRLKLAVAPTLLEYVLGLSYIDPRFKAAPPLTRRWLMARAVSFFHPECRESACHMQSFMWGSGRPAMYLHRNLAPETHTHERLADLNGASDVHYYRHVGKMVRAGRAVKYDTGDPALASLPDDYLADPGRVDTPILFITGDDNRVFTDSNIVCHKLLSKVAPGRHELAIIPGYGHIDTIIGKNAHLDVFPLIVDWLKRKAA
ncbi:alpha/beta fold hydrolase [Bailinhaonella thermotolerans]|uniref:Alpha/beta fold hydrolase n=1 Tax=Bailinhaonella thermotolerans TaxID=1070861 RepID=A0A3A4AS86_9ACTN|nr:alpha/beta fold hydrolase [Bailinhaonella thermotolerans]RJL24178.1 alpha/beta fold hydrolase [Bailinhaonella thermotolerans]